MAIDIIPKKEEAPSIWNVVFYVVAILFVIIIVSSLLLFYLTGRMAREIENKEELIEQQTADKEVRELEREIEGFYMKTMDFESFWEARRIGFEEGYERRKAFAVFTRLEDVLHPEISFHDFQVNFEENRIDTTGVARDIVSFDQQEKIFRKQDFIERYDMSEFSREEGEEEVGFDIRIYFTERIFEVKDIEERLTEEEEEEIEEIEEN